MLYQNYLNGKKMQDFVPATGPRFRKTCISIGMGIALVVCAFSIRTPTAYSAQEMVRVKVKSANLRSGPGKKYKKVWQVPRNYPYRVVTRKGQWIKVKDFEGFEDWIYGPLTDRTPAAVIKVKRANARSGPGTQHPVVFTADKGVAFQVLERKGKWIKVRANDQDEGWIFQSLLWGFFKDSKQQARKKANKAKAK